MTIAFIGVGNYTGHLLRGLFGRPWKTRDNGFCVNLFDIDRDRLNYVARQLLKVHKSRTLASAIANAEIIIVAVPVDKVRGVLSDVKRIVPNREVSVIIMDGANPMDIMKEYPDFFVGAIMFNHFVRTRSGIVGFWRGTLCDDVVSSLSNLLSFLGVLKMVKAPDSLKVIRVVAGVGAGVLLQFLNHLVDCFAQLGFTYHEADQVVRTLLEGTIVSHNEGKTIPQIYESIKGNKGLVTAEMLQVLNSEIYNKMIIEKNFFNALKRIEEIAVL